MLIQAGRGSLPSVSQSGKTIPTALICICNEAKEMSGHYKGKGLPTKFGLPSAQKKK